MANAFSFGTFELLPERNLLLRDGVPVRLGSRAFAILCVLVENAGRVVKSEDLAKRVWPDTSVGDSNLRVHLAAIRKVLNDAEDDGILTVPGRGYSFTLPVVRHKASVQQRTQSNVPALLTRLVGRDTVIQEILQNIDDYRFVSIIGSGGIGKTSVALAVAHIALERFEDGACFVDFAPLDQASSLPSAIARALKIPPSKGTDEATIVEHLRSRRLLMVFDNCEHLIDTSAFLAESILRECPDLSLLATSREPLRADGEYVRRLLPLQSPPPWGAGLSASEALEFPAVQLFVQRAAASLEGFVLQDRDAAAIAQLCNRLDGIPLAIELAAARVDLFDIRTLTEDLDNCLQVFTRGRRTAHERHRTLRAALDWSFRLLTVNEQMLLARLGVFRSAFNSEAAVAVAADKIISRDEVLDGIENLVSKSLLVVSKEDAGPSYRLLETTRAYAIEKLGSGPAANSVRCLHALCMRNQIRRLAPKNGRVDQRHHDSYSRTVDEMRAAISWAFSATGDARLGIELVTTSAHLWSQLSLFEEYRRHVEQALKVMREVPDSAATELSLLNALGPAIYETLGAVPELYSAAIRVVELATKLNDEQVMRGGLHALWRYHHGRGEYTESLKIAEHIREGLESASADEHWWKPLKGLSLLYLGRLSEARSLLTEFEPELPIVDTGVVASYEYNFSVIVNGTLARILWLQGMFDAAAACAESSVNSALKAKQTVAVCFALSIAGCPVNIWNKDFEAAEHNLALLNDYAVRSQSIYWSQYMQVFRNGLSAARGEPVVHPLALKAQQKRWDFRHWENFSVLGEGFASKSIVERAHNDRSWWCSPEILRLEALRIYREGGRKDHARPCALLRNALELAQEQGALAWELRIAKTLLENANTSKEVLETSQLLRRTMEEFTEGFSSREFRDAEQLLQSASRFA